jgi:hypothetical protein
MCLCTEPLMCSVVYARRGYVLSRQCTAPVRCSAAFVPKPLTDWGPYC